MDNFKTKGIQLSGDIGKEFMKIMLHPDKEYLDKRDKIFSKMDQEIFLRRNGMDVEIDIPKLDLTFIDAIIEKGKMKK